MTVESRLLPPLNVIVAEILPQNGAMQRVLKTLGFRG